MNALYKVLVCLLVLWVIQETKTKVQLPSCKSYPWSVCPGTSGLCCCCQNCQTAVCSSFGTNVSVIPPLPAYVRKLKVNGCLLPSYLSIKTFKNLANQNLTYLSLSNNNIKRLSRDAFGYFKHLAVLDLSNNMHIEKDEVLMAIAETEVKKIYLNNISFSVMHDSDLQFLNTSNILTISLTNNNLKKFIGNAFAKIPELKKLNVSCNIMTVFKLQEAVLEKLELLDLSHNELKLYNKITPFCYAPKGKPLRSSVPNLKKLYLINNNIKTITNRTFTCLEKVSYLYLNKNPITTLAGFIFQPLRSLYMLSLKNSDYLETIENAVFANSTIQSLVFSTTEKGIIERFKMRSSIFKNCIQLEKLDLSGTPIPIKQLGHLLKPLRNLTRLRLKDVNFQSMPTSVFSKFPKLSKLYLNKNKIKCWNGSKVFGNMTSLKDLHLDENQITVIKKSFFTRSLFKSLRSISFSGNPIQCSCDNKWLRDYIREHNEKSIKVIGFNSYQCPDKSLFKNYNPGEDDCKSIDYVLISVGTVSGILVVFLLTSGIAYRKRWHIRYRLYLIRNYNYKNGYQKMLNVSSSKYGAYVIYSSAEKDRIWVHKELIPKLEKKHNIKLCIRMRDFAAGGVIMDTMVESLKQSNKVILVLSNNFAKCDWCKFQLTLLHDRLMAEGRSILLLVNFEIVNVDNMNDYLHWLITNNTHFDWSREEVAKRLFWEQVVTALGLPNENRGLDLQSEGEIPNPMVQPFAARLCTVL